MGGKANERAGARGADDKLDRAQPPVDDAAPRPKMSVAEVKADNLAMALDLRTQEAQKRLSGGKALDGGERAKLVVEIETAKSEVLDALFGLPADSASLQHGRRAIKNANALLEQLDPNRAQVPPSPDSKTAAPSPDSKSAAPSADSKSAAPSADSKSAAPSADSKTAAPSPDSKSAASSADSKTAASGQASSTFPLLTAETRELEFPKTVVGKSSRRAIVVRNDDVRPLVLDAVLPIGGGAASTDESAAGTTARAGRAPISHGDTFREIHALLTANVLLEPGERREIVIQFQPKRAARVEQLLRIVTSLGPAGPDGDIRVSGEGIDLGHNGEEYAEQPDSKKSSSVGTEVRIDEQKREVAGQARTHDELAKQRARAGMLVDQWRSAAGKYSHSVAQWTLGNWIDYLGKTGGDHVLHGSAEVVDAWRQLLNKSGRVAAKMGRRAASKAIGLQHPMLRQGVEEALDRIGLFILDKIGLSDGDPAAKSDEHALEATRSTGKAGVQKTDEIFAYESRANLSIEDTASAAELQISRAESAEDLAEWQEWAQVELASMPRPMDARNREFSDLLLRQWVLEHAGTPKDANASTNRKAWDAARDELKGSGKLDSVERTDLFVHQCRHEWGYLGLAEAEQVALQLDAERRAIEAGAREHPNNDSNVAYQVELGIKRQDPSGRLVTFTRTSNPQRLATAFGKQVYQLGPEDTSDVYGLRLFSSEFTLGCNVLLHSEGSGVFAKGFTYDVRGPRGERFTGIRRKPGDP